MNIMRLSDDPIKAARMHPDVTGKSTQNMAGRMCLEAAQIACNAVRINGWTPEFIYGASHQSHPICQWASEAYMNFQYCRTLGLALNQEYKDRVGQSEEYGSYNTLMLLDPDPEIFPQIRPTKQVQCFGGRDDLKRDDPVEGYREYFREVKAPISEWNHVPRPDFLDDADLLREDFSVETDDDDEEDIPDSGLMSFKGGK